MQQSPSLANRSMIGFLILMQVMLAASLFDALKTSSVLKYFTLCVFLESGILFIIYSIIKNRFATTAIAVCSLMLFNLLLTPFVHDQTGVITLPPNMQKKIKIIGETMPGFTGISEISTDAKGFRTTKKINYEGVSSLRIFAIGASTTEQIFIDDKKTWTSLLQTSLEDNLKKNVEIINTGVSGLRAKNHYDTFKHILQYHPDAVLFMMGINDWNADITHRFAPAQESPHGMLEEFLDRISFLNSPTYRILQALKHKILEVLTKRSTTQDEVRLEYGENYSKLNNSLQTRSITKSLRVESVAGGYADDVDRIAKECVRSGVKCFFINQPSGYQKNATEELKRRFWMTPPNQEYTLDFESLIGLAKEYNDFLIVKAEQSGIAKCDIALALPPDTRYFYDDCHFNEEGARRVAQLLSSCLLSDREFTKLDASGSSVP